MKPAVFFDRDGVLNRDSGYVFRKEDFFWMPGAKQTIKFFNDAGWHVFVVTNQSGVARGYYTEDDVRCLHAWMNGELAAGGARVDAFYYCPHHPEAGIGAYKQHCNCRKPAAGMLEQALAEWPVDVGRSLLIGDNQTDVQAAAAAGIRGYLFTGTDLWEFVRQHRAEFLAEVAE